MYRWGWTRILSNWAISAAIAQAAVTAQDEAAAMGYRSIVDGIEKTHTRIVNELNALTGSSVCATVRVQIQQDVVQTRQAFRAEFGIDNSMTVPLQSVDAELIVYDSNGEDVSDLFGITKISSDGLMPFDGSGDIAALASAETGWLIVPSIEAAPEMETQYYIGGFVSYDTMNAEVRYDFLPTQVTIRPLAALDLDYFWQRDVIADDPFTDEIEPSEIFTLGVLVNNRGAGVARDLRIESGQPKIVENEKGLLIDDFEIVGTSVNGQPAERTLNALIGDLEGGGLAVAEWQLESSLQGLFTDYTATFEHISDFGRPELSLVKNVRIHELIRPVQATASGVDDTITDFLVNDVPDVIDAPDTIYFSNGTIADVEQGAVNQFGAGPHLADMSVDVTATMPAGWGYLQTTDPSGGSFELIGVRRSDGTMLNAANFWQTDRTFIGLGLRPILENKVHLLDFDSTGQYEFIYSNGDLDGPVVDQFFGVDPNPTGNAVPFVDVRFSEAIQSASFTNSRVSLHKNGQPVDTTSLTISEIANATYRIGGLQAVSGDDAVYELGVALSEVADLSGNFGDGVARFTWVKGEAAPAVIDIANIGGPRITDADNIVRSAVDGLRIRLTEAVQISSITAAISLVHDGNDLIDASVSVNEVEPGVYEITNLAALQTVDGEYVFTVDAGELLDLQGTAGIGMRQLDWQIDSQAPQILQVFSVTTNPRNTVVQRIDVEMSEAIDLSTFSVDDISLTRDGDTENLLLGDDRVTIEPRGGNVYRIGGISWAQGFFADPQIASFTLTVQGGGISDLAGNVAVGAASTSWTIDLDPPDAPSSITLLATDGSSEGVLSGMVGESGLTLVVKNEFTQAELLRMRLADVDFSLPLTLPAQGRNELTGRLIDAAGNTTDFEIPVVFTNGLPPVIVSTSGTEIRYRRTPVESYTFTFARPVDPTTVTWEAIKLMRNGETVVIPDDNAISVSSDMRTFTLTGLRDFTIAEGSYELRIDLSMIRDPQARSGSGGFTSRWTLDSTVPMPLVTATRADVASTQFFVSIDAAETAGASSPIRSVLFYSASSQSPLRRGGSFEQAQVATEYQAINGSSHVFFATAEDAAGNRNILTIDSDAAFPISIDAAYQADLPDRLNVAPSNEVQFDGDWSVDSPVIQDGQFWHQLRVGQRTISMHDAKPYTNPLQREDIDGNGFVAPLDALRVLNHLNRTRDNSLPPADATHIVDHAYLDVSANGFVTPLDALIVLNYLNAMNRSSAIGTAGEATSVEAEGDWAMVAPSDSWIPSKKEKEKERDSYEQSIDAVMADFGVE
ncbi:MAG: dockerin type I domain-containing protein [Pirellulaceae bacterium]